jgi:hypothetical protein
MLSLKKSLNIEFIKQVIELSMNNYLYLFVIT